MAAPSLKIWTREEFEQLAESGILKPNERLELVEGQIITKVTHNPPHAQALLRVSKWLGDLVGAGFHVRPQLPIALSEFSEPEPDVVVAVGTDELYADRHPEPHEVALLVEVSHSSIARDRRLKLPLYASAGIREVWILDIDARRLEVHRLAGSEFSVKLLEETGYASPSFAPEESVRISIILPHPPMA